MLIYILKVVERLNVEATLHFRHLHVPSWRTSDNLFLQEYGRIKITTKSQDHKVYFRQIAPFHITFMKKQALKSAGDDECKKESPGIFRQQVFFNNVHLQTCIAAWFS